MAPSTSYRDSARASNLNGIYARILSGKQKLGIQHGRIFLEAFCLQPDPVSNIQKLTSSTNGPAALRTALFSEETSDFINNHAVNFLLYLQDPEVKAVYAGTFLQSILIQVMDPPILWDSLLRNVKAGSLSDTALECFGWLLLELLALPSEKASAFYSAARDSAVRDRLDEAFHRGVQINIYKIRGLADSQAPHASLVGNEGPGGRHDNDSADIREISILPSMSELTCKEEPYLRRPTEIELIEHPQRLSAHIDNQFRLLREDMLRELKEEIQFQMTPQSKGRKAFIIDRLSIDGVRSSERAFWSLELECSYDLLPPMDKKDRLQYVRDTRRKFLRHESGCCILTDGKPLVLASIDRHEQSLAYEPPVICVRFNDTKYLHQTLVTLKKAEHIQLMLLNTSIFAYEPVLRQLQSINWLNLSDELMYSTEAAPAPSLGPSIDVILRELDANPSYDLQDPLRLPKTTVLDPSQVACLKAGLTQKVSLVQGPPGTGKSYIGALIAKAIYLYTSKTMLVLSYTNHASVQYLEDLLDVGLPESAIVRLGSREKASDRTQSLGLYNQSPNKRTNADKWFLIPEKRENVREKGQRLEQKFSEYQAAVVTKHELKERSEFDLDNPQFLGAFDLPDDPEGMTRVDKKGKVADKFYLFSRWCRGEDAGAFPEVSEAYSEVWQMPFEERKVTFTRWKEEILNERIESFSSIGISLNEEVQELSTLFREKDREILRSKRIIGCTTTAAAKYVQDIQAASPDVVIVEEAGEILESHILTALGPNTGQLVLIGDHQQLRPKVHFDLSVAKGLGFDADVSLFERLVLKGYPHQTLSEQHRMRPEISALVRELTYPNLTDAAETLSRPDMRGFQTNLMFVNHDHTEDTISGVPDPRDIQTGLSKRSSYEAKMTLACVKYLAQQGYDSEKMVVLTPYVAQLRLLYDVLQQENDPVLNDLDFHDLVKAGLMPSGSARIQRRKLKISSIDNYQGEQSDIVIISLTRSNKAGDIGFLSSPERLNVLLSRARNGMILIGNANTFLKARKGKELWQRLLTLLKNTFRVYDGFAVECVQHPERKAILSSPEDFAKQCPDGGCDKPCGIILGCGKHPCPQKCHRLVDHSGIECMHINVDRCDKGHQLKWHCFKKKPPHCKECQRIEKAKQEKAERDFKRQLKLEREREIHEGKLRELNHKIREVAEAQFDEQTARERKDALEQKRKDLDQVQQRATANREKWSTPLLSSIIPTRPAQSTQSTGNPSSQTHTVKNTTVDSPSELEWARQKRVEDASNDAIDALMAMTGLEGVKSQVLKIKAKIETAQRQGTNLQQERFGISLLGNPGTGKTTVARLYAKFLTSIRVLPGSMFVETTGSRLANDGVNAAKKHIDDLLQSGGGAIFIDEAYQLASGNSFGGSAVLDFLLAEIENLAGKIVFILAGYNKQMEKFFQHNQGFPSRIPYSLQFDDYTDNELLSMFQHKIEKRYNGNMKVEDGTAGLYARILIKRLGRGRGQEGFGNARALENVIARVSERQAERLQSERVAGKKPDDFYLSKRDLIGPEPTNALNESAAWGTLQRMIGLQMVKDSVQNMLTRIQGNYHRELNEKSIMEVSLNRVFLGSPGTGKTTVGQLYGQILKDIGVLSNGEVMIKNPADFVGSALGQSEQNTKAILESAKGKVLIIDEAYMLHTSNDAGGNNTDPYKTAVVDTIVAEVQSTPGEDRCVLLLGYRDKLEEMFKNTNPGLARRFPLDDAFMFEDFTNDELRQILELKLRKQDLDATDGAMKAALDILDKARRRSNFGNGGAVENLITRAKNHYELRYRKVKISERPVDVVFEPEDFDEEYKRSESATINCKELFKDIVGCEDVVEKLEGYTKTATNMRARQMDPTTVIPFNFIFKGPPGTGKTTTARKMGQIFFDMGFLDSNEVIECSTSDLIAPYVGQTGKKTSDRLEKALGRVLFIDEAYRLGEGGFATEAVNELVDNLTKAKFADKMIVILAGYTDDMNRLLQVNQGLASRFPEEVMFENMTADHAFDLLQRNLDKSNVQLVSSSHPRTRSEILDTLEELSSLRSWGNGRDINTMSKDIVANVFRDATPSDNEFSITDKKLETFLKEVLQQKLARERDASPLQSSIKPNQVGLSESLPSQAPPLAPVRMSSQNVATRKQASVTESMPDMSPAGDNEEGSNAVHSEASRDDGVSDETWNQLQKNKQSQQRKHKQLVDAVLAEDQKRQKANQEEEHLRRLQEEEMQREELAARLRSLEKQEEARKARERAHQEHLKALKAKQQAEERLRRVKEALERQQKKEKRVQEKLRHMGVCPVGYQWIKEASGYRCAGGSHFVSNMRLGE